MGSSIIKSSTGWGFTPASVTPGEDGRELGTHFYFFGNQVISVWPFSDDTQVDIIDLSDGNDSRSVSLDSDEFWSTVALPGVTGDRTLVDAAGDTLDSDFVEIVANRPVAVTVGVVYKTSNGFTLDFASTVPTGPDRHESFVYANGVGMEILTYDAETNIDLQTASGDANHTESIAAEDWLGVGLISGRRPTTAH